ncbi:hypothetical protein N431DRAFT_475686 [Stipitochalara longipes BDJ]|nr:hypothetical protein N431DRAFT_475686 [Stipitochalara longipes BDJ]
MASNFLKSALTAFTILSIIADSAQAIPPTLKTSLSERQFCPDFNGPATFFCSGTSPTGTTACGNHYNPNAPGVAISTLLIPNSDDLAQYCGAIVIVEDLDAGRAISAPIIDLCATCTDNPNHIDLSVASYNALSGTSPTCAEGGELFNIQWQIQDQPCLSGSP